MTNTIDEHLGNRIAIARRDADMEAEAAAIRLEMSTTAYQALERGERRVSALMLARVSRLYGRPIGWFYEGLPGQSGFTRPAQGSSV